MSEQYYIRIRGEVKGPFSTDQLKAQIRRKRIGRHHEVSADAMTWHQAGDVPDLFTPIVAERPQPVAESPESFVFTEPNAPKSSKVVQDQTLPQDKQSFSTDAAADANQKDWYYAKGGNKLGPVSAIELQMWLAGGKLAAEDLVWHEDFDNWIPVGELPQFASVSIRNKRAIDEPVYKRANFWEVFWGTSKAAQLPKNAIHKFPNLSRYLKIAETSCRVLFGLVLVFHIVSVILFSGLAFRQDMLEYGIGYLLGGLVGVPLLWLIFLTAMAALEIIRVIVTIEDHASRMALAAGAEK